MEIFIDDTYSLSIRDRHNFSSLKLRAFVPQTEIARVRTALREIAGGNQDEAGNAFVSEAWMRARNVDGKWQQGLDTMLDYARRKGWISPQRGIQIHIEWN